MSDFSPAIIWVLIALASGIVEVAVTHFGLMFVAIGALVAAVVASFHAGIVVQMTAFTVSGGAVSDIGSSVNLEGAAAERPLMSA